MPRYVKESTAIGVRKDLAVPSLVWREGHLIVFELGVLVVVLRLVLRFGRGTQSVTIELGALEWRNDRHHLNGKQERLPGPPTVSVVIPRSTKLGISPPSSNEFRSGFMTSSS